MYDGEAGEQGVKAWLPQLRAAPTRTNQAAPEKKA